MTRTAHYVRSTHWDREWYDTFQGYRMRLVSMLDEVLETMEKDDAFRFVMDGQTIPVLDYLDIRPERGETLRRLVAQGRFKVGPWYVAPDEWLVSGESLVRNLQMGIEEAEKLGAPSSLAGFVCDQFGHTGQLPQIFSLFGINGAFIWRGIGKPNDGHVLWRSPDGTTLPTYRFGPRGYCTLAFCVRDVFAIENRLETDQAVARLVEYTRYESDRAKLAPILLFDGADHLEIEPRMSQIIAGANAQLTGDGIQIIASDLDAYQDEMANRQSSISRTVVGELREPTRDVNSVDEQWLINGCYSSRIHLKQHNAACEDELCLWAEPFSTFATQILDREYPKAYLRQAWIHLLENHPHDSICGCSIDQVHQDMIYRFDQSIGISSRLTHQAMHAITQAAAPMVNVAGSLVIGVFNATAEAIDAPVDLTIPFPKEWPTKFQEFFGFEEKYAFKLRGPDGEEIPYQLLSQRREENSFRVTRYKFPVAEKNHVVTVTARLSVPAFGYTTVVVEPAPGPTRYLGSMASSHRTIQNELLQVTVNSNGTLCIRDKRNGHTFDQLLTIEQRADIGDGWWHGVAVNDQIQSSAACSADVSLIADGVHGSTFRIDLTMNVPASFDFQNMTRSPNKAPLRIVSDVTLRSGADKIEVTTTVHNTVLDHRLRVLFPTGLAGETYWCDSAFDCVERPVALVSDNAARKELDIETRPQSSWTAFGDEKAGLAVISRGLPESAVANTPDRPIALTLLRAFRKAVFSNDNPGGQIQGMHSFRYDIIPFQGPIPVKKLFLCGQRLHATARHIVLGAADLPSSRTVQLPRSRSFAQVQGEVVVTGIQHHPAGQLIRLFNPSASSTSVRVFSSSAIRRTTPGGCKGEKNHVASPAVNSEIVLSAKKIATLLITPANPCKSPRSRQHK